MRGHGTLGCERDLLWFGVVGLGFGLFFPNPCENISAAWPGWKSACTPCSCSGLVKAKKNKNHTARTEQPRASVSHQFFQHSPDPRLPSPSARQWLLGAPGLGEQVRAFGGILLHPAASHGKDTGGVEEKKIFGERGWEGLDPAECNFAYSGLF